MYNSSNIGMVLVILCYISNFERFTIMITYWDIDNTIFVNTLPVPNWDDPSAVHPITREPVCGEMPKYWSHNHLNPQLQPGDHELINHIITGRPEYRREMTMEELGRQGITPKKMWMWSNTEPYTHLKCLEWKAASLFALTADYYIDDDPKVCRHVQEMIDLLGGACHCIRISEWQELIDAGVIS